MNFCSLSTDEVLDLTWDLEIFDDRNKLSSLKRHKWDRYKLGSKVKWNKNWWGSKRELGLNWYGNPVTKLILQNQLVWDGVWAMEAMDQQGGLELLLEI